MSMADRANLKMWRHSSSLHVYKMLHSHSITPWVQAKVLEAGPPPGLSPGARGPVPPGPASWPRPPRPLPQLCSGWVGGSVRPLHRIRVIPLLLKLKDSDATMRSVHFSGQATSASLSVPPDSHSTGDRPQSARTNHLIFLKCLWRAHLYWDVIDM